MKTDRLRIALDDYAMVIVIAGLLVALAGGAVTYDAHFTDPGTETEMVTVDEWQESGEFNHWAAVQHENPIFPVGERMSRESYITGLTPTLDGEYVYRHSHGTEREVTIEVTQVVHSVSGDGTEFWAERTSLGSSNDTVGSGSAVRAEWEVDVVALRDRIGEIEDGLGASPGQSRISVVAEISSRGEDGRQSHADTLIIDPSGSMYAVEADDSLSERHLEREEREIPQEVPPVRSIGGPALLGLGILTGLGIGVARWRGVLTVPPDTREEMAYRRTRASLDEWITVASRPQSRNGRDVITVQDLEGLVDLAIDTDQRVIEDHETANLYIRTADTLFVYSPPIASMPWDALLPTNRHKPIGDRLLDPEQQRLLEFNGGGTREDASLMSRHSVATEAETPDRPESKNPAGAGEPDDGSTE